MPRQRFAVAFLQIFGGSKRKRDKGGMPDEPGHRQKLRQAKSLPQLTRCYEFEIVLPIVCRSEGKERHRNSFSGIRKVLPGKRRPDPGFPNFLRADEVGSKIKREKGPASSRRPWVRCRAVPDPVLELFRKIIPFLRTFSANLDRRQQKRVGARVRCRDRGFPLEPQRFCVGRDRRHDKLRDNFHKKKVRRISEYDE